MILEEESTIIGADVRIIKPLIAFVTLASLAIWINVSGHIHKENLSNKYGPTTTKQRVRTNAYGQTRTDEQVRTNT